MTGAAHDAFARIVVGFDGLSQGVDALHLARALAGDDTELIVCCVHPASQDCDGERRLRPAREALAGRERTRFSVRAASSPAAGLHDEAEESGADLLVVGSSHRGPVGRIVPGSVTRQTLHAAPCAVAIAPLWLQSAGELPLRLVGVGYDGGAAAGAALACAAEISRSHDGRVRLMTVIPPAGGSWSAAWVWPPTPDPGARQEIDAEAHRSLADVRDVAGGTVQLLDGTPAEELVRASADLDLLVLGSRGYGPVRRVLLGTVSTRVAESASCPVIVVPRPTDGAAHVGRLTTAAAEML